MGEPGIEGGRRTEAGLGRVGADGDALALAVLIGLGTADSEQQAFVGDTRDVTEGEADELGAAERGAEADQ